MDSRVDSDGREFELNTYGNARNAIGCGSDGSVVAKDDNCYSTLRRESRKEEDGHPLGESKNSWFDFISVNDIQHAAQYAVVSQSVSKRPGRTHGNLLFDLEG